MKYDFTTVLDRRSLPSTKWNAVKNRLGPGYEDVIASGMADTDFKAAPEICKAVAQCAEKGFFGYFATPDSYYEAVCHWMETRHDWKIEKDWIQTTTGVIPAVNAAVCAYTEPGDGVIIQPPVYHPFYGAADNNGRKLVKNELIYKDGKYSIDFEDLEEKMSDPANKLMILCSPHNPIGRVWTKEELVRIGELCLKHNVLLVCDEIHFDIILKPYKHTVFASISPEFANIVTTCTAPSKTFSMAGLMCSNIIISNPELREKFKKTLASMNSGAMKPNYLAIKACEAAYTSGAAWVDAMNDQLTENREIAKKFFAENMPDIPVCELEGTYLMWVDFNSLGLSNEELATAMQETGRVLFNQGSGFGGDGFERVNIGCPPETLMKILEGMKRVVDSVKNK